MEKNSHSQMNTAVAAGAVGVAAAAIGAYWLYGAKHAEKHRKMAASWVLKARAEVMELVEKVTELDKSTYLAIVDDVVQKYAKSHGGAKDVAAITKEMKSAWSHIDKATKPTKKASK